MNNNPQVPTPSLSKWRLESHAVLTAKHPTAHATSGLAQHNDELLLCRGWRRKIITSYTDIVFVTFSSPRRQESYTWDGKLNTNKLCLITLFQTVNSFVFWDLLALSFPSFLYIINHNEHMSSAGSVQEGYGMLTLTEFDSNLDSDILSDLRKWV